MRTILCVAVAALILSTVSAQSVDDKLPALALELQSGPPSNVDDNSGRWQFSGGKVTQKGEHVANYASIKRVVTNATQAQNAAMVTTTVFFF